jgi:hypothetical protein
LYNEALEKAGKEADKEGRLKAKDDAAATFKKVAYEGKDYKVTGKWTDVYKTQDDYVK